LERFRSGFDHLICDFPQPFRAFVDRSHDGRGAVADRDRIHEALQFHLNAPLLIAEALESGLEIFMPLPKFFLESADHVLNEFRAQHLVPQTRQKVVFQLLTLDPQTVSANAIAALRMERASVLRS
jgi:hypothetical protein